uniref:PHD-type domain-containing protein n=1 Tax=Ciona savignyi TaxID=51511 RepID=H2ZAJ3_CIOSA
MPKQVDLDSCKYWWRKLGVKKIPNLPSTSVCVFCLCNDDCENKYGELIQHSFSGMKMHYLCLLLASGLNQSYSTDVVDVTNENDSIYGFLIKDILTEITRASKLRCTYCHRIGASIGCAVTKCKAKFHLNCGLNEGMVSQFFGEFPSFCRHHRPKQESVSKVRATTCPICLDDVICSVDDVTSLKTPCCHEVWLHRACVQQHASSSALHFFRCPVCNDKESFSSEMKRMGINIPERDAAWERTHDAFHELLHRHSQCDVESCVCPHGRDFNMKGTEWAVVLCDLCGSSGTHISCHEEVDSENSYHACADCEAINGPQGARDLAIAIGVISPEVKSKRKGGKSRNGGKSRKQRKRLKRPRSNRESISSDQTPTKKRSKKLKIKTEPETSGTIAETPTTSTGTISSDEPKQTR